MFEKNMLTSEWATIGIKSKIKGNMLAQRTVLTTAFHSDMAQPLHGNRRPLPDPTYHYFRKSRFTSHISIELVQSTQVTCCEELLLGKPIHQPQEISTLKKSANFTARWAWRIKGVIKGPWLYLAKPWVSS